MKNNDLSFNFIRAVCALGIIIYHFSCHLPVNLYRPLFFRTNFSWGACFVTVFFILSGLLIYRNNKSISSLKTFYLKRIKSIFPAFYIAFFCFFALNVVKHGEFFYNGNPKSLILSFIGMDGYFLYKVQNYYILGEWFLGAIILLYLIYPFLLKVFNRFPILTFLVTTGLFVFAIYYTGFEIPIYYNLFTCLFGFAFGMIMERYELYKKAWLLVPCVALSIILMFIKVPLMEIVSSRLMGICLTFILYYIGKLVMNFKYSRAVFNEISSISYPIFYCSILLSYSLYCTYLLQIILQYSGSCYLLSL